jgi:hypothetical protein
MNNIKEKTKLKPEFIEKMKKIQKQKSIRVNDFAKRYNLYTTFI